MKRLFFTGNNITLLYNISVHLEHFNFSQKLFHSWLEIRCLLHQILATKISRAVMKARKENAKIYLKAIAILVGAKLVALISSINPNK